jgi:carbon-monoxide dehydrogenase large subunit
MHGELAFDAENHVIGMRASILSDQGAFYADAQPTKFRAGLFHICTGSYDFSAAHVTAKGAFTNKAPGGVAYRCSFRVTEASYLIERLMDTAAHELGVDATELRAKNFIRKEQFPWLSPTGFVYDSGDYHQALDVAKSLVDYDGWRAKQAVQNGGGVRHDGKPNDGKRIGIGIASFTEVVGAGNSKEYDIAGIKMFDSAELRVHPTGKAILKLGVQTQGQGHETTFAQIVAEELGIPPEDVEVRHGDTDKSPYGLGTYGSRSTPVSGAAVAVVSRKVRDKARLIAATMLETRPEDLAWEKGRWYVKGDPEKGAMIEDIARRAYSGETMPEGLEGGLDAQVI